MKVLLTAILFAILIAWLVPGCAREAIIHDMKCQLVERNGTNHCFCSATYVYQGYLTWAPKEVCGKR